MRQTQRSWLLPLITVIVSLAVWQVAVDALGIPARVLASPWQIVRSFAATWPELLTAAMLTSYEALTGFLLSIGLGVLAGVVLYSLPVVRACVMPLLVATQTIPLISVAPLLMIWFGFEPVGKIVLVTIFSMFTITVQTARGLAAVPQYFQDVALTCGASKRWTLWHVQLRVAGHQIFTGIRISATYVYGSAVTAEYLGSRGGFGVWLQGAFNSFRTAPIFTASLTIIGLTGLLLLAVNAVEHLLLGSPQDDPMKLA